MLTVARLRHCGCGGFWQNDGQEELLPGCATGAVTGRPPFTLAPGGSGRFWVRQPPPSSSSSGTALRPTRCWMDGWRVNSCLSPAQSWGHSAGHRQELVSFKHSARPKAASLAATSPVCSERRDRRRGGKLLQDSIRNISAFTAPGLCSPTRALPPARGPGPTALLPPEPLVPTLLCSLILGELLEKQQPTSCREPRSWGRRR